MLGSKRTIWIWLLDGVVLLLILCAGFLAEWMMEAVPTCPVAVAGYRCAACGSTRCVLALSRLDLATAFSVHPLLCILLCHGFVALLSLNLGFLANRPLFRRAFRGLTDYRVVIAWAVAYALFGILRNL